jgi:hypothetical protein
MTVVFDKRQRARISLPLRIRTQICKSLFQLFQITGAEIHHAIKKDLRHSKKERLAFCVVNRLLMLTYEHCHDQTSREAALPVLEEVAKSGEYLLCN